MMSETDRDRYFDKYFCAALTGLLAERAHPDYKYEPMDDQSLLVRQAFEIAILARDYRYEMVGRSSDDVKSPPPSGIDRRGER